ncbi:MAG: hypothetical protein ACLFS9_06695 [Nitriliruptoraceae bacterium]
MILLVIPVVALAIVLGVNLGWQWVLAPLLAYALLRWSLASLRVLATDAAHVTGDAAETIERPSGERTLFWCEECGTELLLLHRGTSRAPSHCGQRMHERTEIAQEG